MKRKGTYQIVYKCRQCGLEFSPIDGDFDGILEFLYKSISTHTNRLYAIHSCNRDKVGIADLIGTHLMRKKK